MPLDRRNFLKTAGLAGVTAATVPLPVLGRSADSLADSMGVLVDIPNCIGCRKCEYACRQAAGFGAGPIEAYDDKSVFRKHRRPAADTYTAVNEFANPIDPAHPVYVKTNCLHCNDPACVSACLVGAFTKEPNGAVVYDAWKCMGCRYCMVACPFQIPAYEYDNALAPQVRKCTLCFDRISKDGGIPACVQICPRECLTYGRRSDLLTMARERITAQPDKYLDHIYGEHEAGGTAWLYLSGVPFTQLGLPALGSTAPSEMTETLQHAVFKFWAPPLALYGLLGLIHWLSGKPQAGADEVLTMNESVAAGERTSGNGKAPRLAPKRDSVLAGDPS